MASCLSSAHFIPASNSQSWEVFLSFRGEDTRKGFVDHLYVALVQQGIITYKDEETLPRGETIRPALLKAIQESHISVVVFSENYVDSSWCLDELAYIIECKEKRGQIVMLVFYNVDPSDVRKQKGKYGEAFIKHERENKHKVDSWREALAKAGNISGWVTRDFANGHEAKCIENIVASISNRLSPLITNVNKDLIGIETRLQDLKSKLNIGSGGVRMVGIWGVGGVGKSTLASAAYMEISHQFEACCLLENIREESTKHGLKKLQANMLSLVLKKDVPIGSELEGKSMIKRSLCHKSVLVVLDDVNDFKQLDALAGSHDWFGEGSRIIITTRDEHLLNLKEATIYEVSLLSDVEAVKLFSRHAFKKDEPIEDYKTLSQKVVSYASRLPLALEILGSFLYDKDKDEWKSTLAKLKCIPDVEVMERLKISYDGLKDDEKKLFLDIACFKRRSNIDLAMIVLDAFSFQPRIGVKVLVQKSLIKVSDGRFDMHDLVEEMAHYIVIGEHPDDPEKQSRIWNGEDIMNLCAMGAATPLMETEVLAIRDGSLPFTFWLAFQKKKKGIWFPKAGYNNHRQHLHNVIANMKKLRWIDWEEYPASSFSSNFQPTRLGCLMLKESCLKQLWKGFKSLPGLKILDLSWSQNLRRTPDFKGLPGLERLNLEGCIQLKEIHPSIGYHKRLVWVNMKGCDKLKSFPPIIQMMKLETLVLSKCYRLKNFLDIQTNMDSLANLHLDETGIELIPPSIGQFCTNLVYFDLRSCYKLKRIEGNFRLLTRLKYLQLFGSNKLEKLAEDIFDKECCLEELSLFVSLKLPQFPCFLRKLNLSYCLLGDGDVPSNMSGLLNLQVLDLSCNKFSRLHSSLSQIPCLKFLNLSYCNSLVELSNLPSSIAILNAEWCESLQSVGDLSNCKWLWKVSLWRKNPNRLTGDERLLHSMLQANAVEDRFISLLLPPVHVVCTWQLIRRIRLQLPHNWYNDFSGFLLSADECQTYMCNIYIKQDMLSMDSHNQWEEFDKNSEIYKECRLVGYVPFKSLRHTSWWNPTNNHITFILNGMENPNVRLVPRKGKSGDSRERPIDCSECWEEEIGHTQTFQINYASKSSENKGMFNPITSKVGRVPRESKSHEHEDRKTFEIKDDSKSSAVKIVWEPPNLYRRICTY